MKPSSSGRAATRINPAMVTAIILMLSLATTCMTLTNAQQHLGEERLSYSWTRTGAAPYIDPRCSRAINRVAARCSHYPGQSWFQLPTHLSNQCCRALDGLRENCYQAIVHSWGRLRLFESLSSSLCGIHGGGVHQHQERHHHGHNAHEQHSNGIH